MRTTKPIVFTGVVLATLIHANAGGRAQAEQVRGGTVQTTQPNIDKRRLSPEDVRKVAPALEAYTQERLYGEIWKRPGLAPRDRSLVTIAALIARDQSPALTYYFDQALENGVKPREISETITHLAFATRAGRTGSARSDRREMYSHSEALGRINSPPCPCNRCRSTNRRRPLGRSWSASNSARPHPASSNTRRTCCSVTSGSARILRPAIGVS
jgi:alkylhydroperoxidase/carboxymuconolactone decarboxylase family protein YurZ